MATGIAYFIIFWFGFGNCDFLEGIVDFSGLAVDFLDGDCGGHGSEVGKLCELCNCGVECCVVDVAIATVSDVKEDQKSVWGIRDTFRVICDREYMAWTPTWLLRAQKDG